MRLIFLGTGGSYPTKERNVSSVALRMNGEVLLLDCAEGTQRQLASTDISFMRISTILISHFHGDHFLGLPGLLQTMYLNDREGPLEIIGPQGTTKLLTALLGVGYFKRGFKITLKDMVGEDEVKKGGYTIRSLKVDHDIPAIAFSVVEDLRPGKFNKPRALELGIPEGPLFGKLQRGEEISVNGEKITPEMVMGPSRPGRKIVYSGDTRAIPQMADFAKDCDVLIHDSTMDHSLLEKARDYGHSTAKEAAQCAKDAGAQKLFLTHISPRFSEDATLLEEEAKEIFESAEVAEDFLEYEVRFRE